MYKLSVNKELFEDILLRKTNLLTKENNKYWKKELLDISIINDKISYKIKQFDKLTITNGLGSEKPQLVVECTNLNYPSSYDRFEFYLGKILEQKNTNLGEDYKDNLIEQLLKEKEALQDSINRDPLTNVYNRRKMQSDLEKFALQNNAFMLSAVFIDADRFKGINDYFGHDAGDRTLIHLANELQEYSKQLNAEVYRYGGEEFVLLCFIAKDRLLFKLEELKRSIKAKKIKHEKKDISVSVSMGVAFYCDYNSIDLLLKKADEGVYKAKNNGRDRIELM